MGNKSSSKHNNIIQEETDDFEGFFLEDWEILSDKSKLANYSKKKKPIII